MADKLRLGCDVRELKIGASFINDKSTSFHTLKCDFKPASVDATKMATVDVETNNQVTVTVPHLDGAGIPQTVFKGNQRPYQKECVLIIDRKTGEITLERLSSNIQVKKTRQEPPQKSTQPHQRPQPAELNALNNCTQRSTSRTKVTSGKRNQVSSKAPKELPPRPRTEPPTAAPWNGGQSTLASLPMIGFDDLSHTSADINHTSHISPNVPVAMNGHGTNSHASKTVRNGEEVGVLSSSSGSSSSGSDSEQSDSVDSDSDNNDNSRQYNHTQLQANNHTTKQSTNGLLNGNSSVMGNSSGGSMPMHLLKDDLRLSESGSDSD